MTETNLNNVQGDLFSRGFPKYHETYYFFTIQNGKEKEFTQALTALGKSGDISSINKVLDDWRKIDKRVTHEVYEISNALIAFSMQGLWKVQAGLGGKGLELDEVRRSDLAFSLGMAADTELNDPKLEDWDPLFRSKTQPIHGLLKVAGDCLKTIEGKLEKIKMILGYPYVIADIAAQSPPSTVDSRVDGHVRPEDLRGKEHFGFEDGISQPLMKGIDSEKALKDTPKMQTEENVIIVSKPAPVNVKRGEPPAPRPMPQPERRPKWMNYGSFLVFRKLEQDVKAFEDLVALYAKVACDDAEHCSAKLMGRWKNGKPVVITENQNPSPGERLIFDNNFAFDKEYYHHCPLAAHIRKTNPRSDSYENKHSRMVRAGIPYGTEYSQDMAGKRGLLFACYQSNIDNSFQFVQQDWSNHTDFPKPYPPQPFDSGIDPFIGQVVHEKDLRTTMFTENNLPCEPGFGTLPKIVTMKGGEYFFVPSIPALSEVLGST